MLKQRTKSVLQQAEMARTQADMATKQDEMSYGIKALLEMLQIQDDMFSLLCYCIHVLSISFLTLIYSLENVEKGQL